MAVKTKETQISAIQDDGTPEGVIRAKIIGGELMRVPAIRFDWAGTYTLVQNSANNIDGSFSALNISVGAGLLNYTVVSTYFKGRNLALVLRWISSIPFPDFTATIDDVLYPVIPSSLITARNDREVMVPIATDLPDREHQLKLILNPLPSASQSFVLYGMLVDKRPGYQTPKGGDLIYNSGKLTTTLTTLVDSGADSGTSGTAKMNFLTGIQYTNTDAVNRTISLTWNGLEIFKDRVLAPKETLTWTPPNPVSFGRPLTGGTERFQQKADADNVVNYFLFGTV